VVIQSGGFSTKRNDERKTSRNLIKGVSVSDESQITFGPVID
jgi:hypothetical protein